MNIIKKYSTRAVVMAVLLSPIIFAGSNVSAQTIKNKAPVINGISSPTVLNVDQTGVWSVRASDPENGNLSYSVDWGEGLTLAKALLGKAGFVQTTTFDHKYASPGVYKVQFTVMDDAGASSKSSVTVQVKPNGTQTLIINDLSATSTKPDKARIAWRTNANADSMLWYGTSSPVDTSGEADVIRRGKVLYHMINLTHLKPDTTYYAIVKSSSKNQGVVSEEISFKTPPLPSLAPVIKSLNGPTSLVQDEEGTWTLETSDPKNTELSYSVNWGDEELMKSLALHAADVVFTQTSTFSHTYSLPGTYDITFTVKNAAGLTAEKHTSVVVAPSGDITPPILSNIVATSTEEGEALFTWSTDEVSSSALHYSTSTPVVIDADDTTTVSDTNLVLNHSLSVTDLTASTTYYFVIQSTDEAGNVSSSSEIQFLVP